MRHSILLRLLMTAFLLLGAGKAASAADRLYCEPMAIAPGATATISFQLENSKACYGFQTDITLPEGLQFVTQNNKAKITLTDRAAGFTTVSNLATTNQLRLGAFSQSQAAFAGSSGALFSVEVKATSAFAGGQLTLSQTSLADKDANDTGLTDFSVAISAYYSPTAISLNLPQWTAPAGSTTTLKATIAPDNATDKTVTWSSSDSDVATVDASGKVSALKPGTATVTATAANGLKAECKVTVEEVMASKVELDKTSAEINIHHTLTLKSTITPTNTTNKTITWTSSNPAVATVDASGTVTGESLGETIVTATTANGKTAKCTVKVIPWKLDGIEYLRVAGAGPNGEDIVKVIGGGPDANGALSIPESVEIEGKVYVVTEINPGVFKGNIEITSVVIPAGMLTIGAEAFAGCSGLREVDMPDGVATLACGTDAFKGAPVATLYLGRNTSGQPFGGNTTLTDLSVGKNVTSISAGDFSGCTSITDVRAYGAVPPALPADGFAQTVYDNATLHVPDANSQAYKEATGWKEFVVTQGFTEILPEKIIMSDPSIEIVEKQTATLSVVFEPANTTNKNVTWRSSNTKVATVSSKGVVMALKAGTTTITATSVTTTADGETPVASCTVTVVALTSTVGGISYEVVIGGGPNGEDAVKLTGGQPDATGTLRIPGEVEINGTTYPVTVIEAGAFAGRTDINRVVIPANIVSVGDEAFAGCTALRSVEAEDGDKTLNCGENAFKDAPITTLYLGRDTSGLPFKDKNELENLTFGSQVSVIDPADFEGCERIKTVTVLAPTPPEVYKESFEDAVFTSAQLRVPDEIVGAYKAAAVWQQFANIYGLNDIIATDVEMELSTLQLTEGENATLKAVITPDNATDKTLTWSSSDETVATVDASGKVTALKPGSATITATTSNGLTASCQLTIEAKIIEVESIELNTLKTKIIAGETFELTATITPTDATDQTIVWTSSDQTVATVSDAGVVTGVAPGTAIITATAANGKNSTCEVTVEAATELPGSDRFSIEDARVATGQTLQLAFNLNNSNSYFGFQMNIQLPDGLEFVTDTNNKVTYSLTERLGSDYSIVSKLVAPGKVSFGGFSIEHQPIGGESGTLFTLTVRATDKFEGGAVIADGISFVGPDDQDVSFPDVEAEIGLKAENSLYIRDFTVAAGEKATVSIELDNQTAFSAFQTDLYLPQGMTLVEGSMKLTARASTGHNVSAKSVGEGVATRIVCISYDGASIEGNSGAILEFEVQTSADIAATSVINLRNNIFSNSDAEEFKLPDTQAIVTATRNEPTAIRISPEAWEGQQGTIVKLTATIVPDNAYDKTVSWTSSNEAVATIGTDGSLTALSPGQAIITAKTANGLTATCAVTVKARVVTPGEISLDRSEAQLDLRNTLQLIATISPADATDQSVSWTSSDESIATVDAYGLVTPHAVGQAVISARTVNGLEALCLINVFSEDNKVEVESMKMSIVQGIVNVGAELRLYTMITPIEAAGCKLTWTSNDQQVATVDGNGNVVALSEGDAIITARAENGVEAHCMLMVRRDAVLPEWIILNHKRLEMSAGETEQLVPTLSPGVDDFNQVYWRSSNSTIVSIDTNGKVKAKAPGIAIVTATTVNGCEATCLIRVEAIECEYIELNKTSLELKVGDSEQLEATIYPDEATDKSIIWSSSNSGIATVDESGRVTGISYGTVKITATTGNGLEAVCNVTVKTTSALGETDADGSISVAVRDGVIIVEAPDDLKVEVYALTGMRLVHTPEHYIEGLGRGAYIVRVGTKTFKIVI